MGIQWLSISVRNGCFELQNRNQKCHGGYWAQTFVIWPSQKCSSLTLFFCVPTSNTTILFDFHHLLCAFEDPKLTFLTFPKLHLNPTGITLHQFLWWINYSHIESHQAKSRAPSLPFSSLQGISSFPQRGTFFFWNLGWASQGKKNNESTHHTWNLKVKLWSQIWKTSIILLKTTGNRQF